MCALAGSSSTSTIDLLSVKVTNRCGATSVIAMVAVSPPYSNTTSVGDPKNPLIMSGLPSTHSPSISAHVSNSAQVATRARTWSGPYSGPSADPSNTVSGSTPVTLEISSNCAASNPRDWEEVGSSGITEI